MGFDKPNEFSQLLNSSFPAKALLLNNKPKIIIIPESFFI
jgi:hypothetical protein